MSLELAPGLYIVATPIGNLSDLSPRAAAVLAGASLIAAEDKRVTARLLQHIGVKRPMTVYNDHSSDRDRENLLTAMREGPVALVSDAGTPLISDPGFKLVRAARAEGISVTTLPGPSAAVAALTLAGLPTDRFLFAGFLPAKAAARDATIAELGTVRATLVLYESGNRIAATLAALAEGLGDREAAVAREISKKFEETLTGRLGELSRRLAETPRKGEMVIVVGPPEIAASPSSESLDAALAEALEAMSVSRAAAEVSRRLRLPRRQVYERALALKPDG